ncbi:unnamed protein product [Mycena citricolor]|uniref:PHD-type domain-containing protein n=1 Tax=Mycena citricolor TaxID=2018698 RepID=A0AAD2HTQ8_9AGAR|nr:unnamed protein product [Mycena citricolor]CAK5281730.1 unnamed protein product [Mycena citricolor]
MAPQSPTSRRRSNRPFSSPAVSKSPDSEPRDSRPKRLKQEDIDAPVDAASSTSSASNGRSVKRKSSTRDKDKDKFDKDRMRSDDAPMDDSVDGVQGAAEEEDNGVTRCICGREDDPDAGEFMVQCETCKVWQHGLCMGYDSEAQLHDDDYYCEQCRPDFHSDHLRKSRRKPRQSSAASHNAPARQSRSHSPSLHKQPSKRRNTMNSRDAAFDENLKEILETTAAEAGTIPESASVGSAMVQGDAEEDMENGVSNRKKRKRIEDDAPVKKRTRSASEVSDHRVASAVPRDESPPPAPISKAMSAPKSNARRRGGRKAVVQELPVVSMEGEEAMLVQPTKRGGRAKGASAGKRGTTTAAVASAGNGDARRGHVTAVTPVNEASRAYRNSHAFAVSQQPMFTSWGLPDYLAHLEAILPTNAPQPLEVMAGGGSAASRAGSLERTMERGVKVKWPAKRMSVGDMNKRVRALVEWVGREQVSASDRAKRKEALEKALEDGMNKYPGSAENGLAPNNSMALDSSTKNMAIPKCDPTQASNAMKMMEELMEELIKFQERFGPGARRRVG